MWDPLDMWHFSLFKFSAFGVLTPLIARNYLDLAEVDWLQIGQGVRQGCILSPCLFNFCAEYIMRNTGLEEAQAGRSTSWNQDCWEKYQ